MDLCEQISLIINPDVSLLTRKPPALQILMQTYSPFVHRKIIDGAKTHPKKSTEPKKSEFAHT